MYQINSKRAAELLKKKHQLAFRRWLTGESPGHNRIVPYIGADREFVKQWISDQFVSGMEWSNYGTIWVVTHIVPLRFFDFTKEDDLKIGLHYKNIMPLFKEDILFKENALYLSLEILQLVPACEITEKLKAILLIKIEKLNKYIPVPKISNQEINAHSDDVIDLPNICLSKDDQFDSEECDVVDDSEEGYYLEEGEE